MVSVKKKISITIPVDTYQLWKQFSKHARLSMGKYINLLIKREAWRVEGEKLKKQYDALADDAEYQVESKEWVDFAMRSAGKILSKDPYES